MKLPLNHTSTGNESGGFTLPEVSIAVAVCMIGMVGLLALLPNAMMNARNATDLTLAARIAEDEFTEYRAAIAAIPTGGSFPPTFNRPPWNTGSTASAIRYYDANGNACLVDDIACRFEVRIASTARAAAYGQVRDVVLWVRWPYRRAGGRTGLESYNSVSNGFFTSVTRYERP